MTLKGLIAGVLVACGAVTGADTATPQAVEGPAAEATSGNSAAAAARMTASAGAFLKASGVGDATWSHVQRLDSATSSTAGYTITWGKMSDAQRAAADAFFDAVLSAEWSERIRGMIAVGMLVSGERPVTLSITKEKETEHTWVWSVIGRDLSLRWAFSAERVESVGPLVITARGGRASVLAPHDEAATHLMDDMPQKLSKQSTWGDMVVKDGVTAPRSMGVTAAQLKRANHQALRDLVGLTTGILREDVASHAGAALASEELFGKTRLVWAGARHPSLPHAHRVAGEGFTITMTMTPPRDDEEAVAKLEWDEKFVKEDE